MDYKKISRGGSGDVEREAVKKPEFEGRRRFLTTVAAAGAMIALLGVGSPAAQEKPFSGGGNAYDHSASTGEENKGAKIVNGINQETGRKIIPQSIVERLVKNAEEGSLLGVSTFPNQWIGGKPIDMYETDAFGYSAVEESENVIFQVKSKNVNWAEKIILTKEEAEGMKLYRFSGEKNLAASDEVVVMATGNRTAIWFFDASFQMPTLIQFSYPQNKRMPNFFEDGEVKPLKQAIGYENKDGEITIISVPENAIEGDSVLRVKINKAGAVSSEILIYKEEKIEIMQFG